MLSSRLRLVHKSLQTLNMRSAFIQNSRSLEKFKTEGIPHEAYLTGNYLLFFKNIDSVLLDVDTGKLSWKKYIELPEESKSNLTKIILKVVGEDAPICLFAVDLCNILPDNNDLEKQLKGKLVPARSALFTLDPLEASLLSQARGLVNFMRITKFCSYCGSSLTLKLPNQKNCDSCNKTYYPSLSPVGITLIENAEHTKILLVRQSRHPRGMYSCVAGFIEPGETLEENVQREIAEEVGLDVKGVVYKASQHWALSDSQLMLGCVATAVSEDFKPDNTEIESAQWVDAPTLKDAVIRAKQKLSIADLNEKVLWVPPPTAVAHTLMEIWLGEHHGYVASITSRI